MAAPLGFFKVTDNVDVIAADHMNSAIMQGQPYFGSAAARDSAWPTPHDGAICWLTDSHTPWRYRGSAWHAAPLGTVAYNLGPVSQVDVGNTTTNLAAVTYTVVAGRRYRISGYCGSGSQITATGTIVRQQVADDVAFTSFSYSTSLAVGAVLMGSGFRVYDAATTKSVTFATQALANNGALRTTASTCAVLLEDIGN